MSREMKKKIVLLPYDFDTAIGINNEGSLVFSYNLEDTDIVDDAEVFNGQDSVLWNNLRRAFARELRAMYRDLRSQGIISYDTVERMFEEHQGKWTASIFNEDSWYKYIDPLRHDGDDSYLSMMQGDKAEQRKWWLNNRFRYIDSKYNAGDALTDVITLRGYAKANISITPYADIYPTIKYGSYLVSERGQRGTPTTLICPLDRVNDTEIYCYSASQIASVGDLAPLKVGYANFSMAARLQSLKLGDPDPEYSNRNLKTLYLGNNTLLRSIDVRNCSALGTDKQKAIDLSGCSNIEHVYFDNTAVSSVALPNGGILKTLHLPSTVSDLTILNQRGITDFTIPSTENLTSLRLENVSSVVDSLSILRSLPAQSSVRLIGFGWNCASNAEILGVLNLLDTMHGIDERGESTTKPQIYGTIHVPAITTDQIRAIQARYHDITVTADVVSYRMRFFNGSDLLHTAFVESGGDVADPVTAGTISTPYKESVGRVGYAYAGWDKPLTNITADTDLYATYTETRSYEVNFIVNGELVLTKMVAEGATCPDPVQTGEIPTPTKEPDENNLYTFLGWTGGSLVNVRQDRTLTASFSATTSYTIKFVNWDGTELYRYYLSYGVPVTDPIKMGFIDSPARPDDNNYEYTYKQWSNANSDGSLSVVTGNRTHTAQYTTKQIVWVTFNDENSNFLFKKKYYYGGEALDPVALGEYPVPTKEADGDIVYTFWRWNLQYNGTFPVAHIYSHQTATAAFRTNQVWTVKFVDYNYSSSNPDANVLYTVQVQDADLVTNPVTEGLIATPLRQSSTQYDYTFSGWNWNFRNPVRSDRVITAGYTQTFRSYTISFYSGQTLMKQVSTLYGANAVYSDWPDKPGEEGQWYLDTWTPLPTSIRGNMDVYASWKPVITDTWSEIFAAERDGTYRTKYSVGQIKLLDMGSEGIIAMRINGIDKDEKPDGTKAPITWIALNPIKSKSVWGYADVNTSQAYSRYNFNKLTDANGEYWESNNKIDRSVSASIFTISAEQDADVSIQCWCSGESGFDVLTVWDGDEAIVEFLGGDDGRSKTVVRHITAGTPLSIFAQYYKDAGVSAGQDKATIRFVSESAITITMSGPQSPRNLTGTITRGYQGSELRDRLVNDYWALLPAEVKNNIVEVKKYSSTDVVDNVAQGEWSVEKLWAPSGYELCLQYAKEDQGVCYDDLYEANSTYPISNHGMPIDYSTCTRSRQGKAVGRISSNGYLNFESDPYRPRYVLIGFCT